MNNSADYERIKRQIQAEHEQARRQIQAEFDWASRQIAQEQAQFVGGKAPQAFEAIQRRGEKLGMSQSEISKVHDEARKWAREGRTA